MPLCPSDFWKCLTCFDGFGSRFGQNIKLHITSLTKTIAPHPVLFSNQSITFPLVLLQPRGWRCVACVIHYERDVREEQHPYICGSEQQGRCE